MSDCGPQQLAKRKAEELEDFGTADSSVAAKHSKSDVEVRLPPPSRTKHCIGLTRAWLRGGPHTHTQAGDQAMAQFLKGVRDLPLATLSDDAAMDALTALRTELQATPNPYVREVLAEL